MATNVSFFSTVVMGTMLRPPTSAALGFAKRTINSCNLGNKKMQGSDFGCPVQISVQPKERGKPVASHYQPNMWDYESLQLLKTDHCDELMYRARILAEEMRDILGNEDTDSLSMLELIDKVQRFGLGYRFENNIKKALEIRVLSLQELGKKGHDLHAVALSFRILRQHGYNVSQDVFKKFMDKEGNFKAEVEEDVRGMLSLYEASHLGFEGESILVEAITFTKTNLMKKMSKDNMLKMSKGLEARVSHALETPLHHRTQRDEARWSIEEEYNNFNNDDDDKEEDEDEVEESTKYPKLLELAKLDFNMVQSALQTDLKEVSSWWKELGLSGKLSFARDRLVETFFCVMGAAYEPQQSKCLKDITKLATLLTTIDDIFDVHGTLHELEIFTNAVQRWDVQIIEDLPDYMKLCYFALYNTVNEMAYDTLKQHGHNSTPSLSKAWGDVCQSFLQEAKWNHNKEIPRIDEYLKTSWLSSSGALFLVHAYFLVSEDITEEALRCLEEYHHILYHPSLLFRLYNDCITSKAELQSRESANSVICYMNETCVSEEEARRKVRDVIEKTWREMNESNVNINESPFSGKFIEAAFNVARIALLTYGHRDTYGAPDIASKNRIKSLIMEPISFS